MATVVYFSNNNNVPKFVNELFEETLGWEQYPNGNSGCNDTRCREWAVYAPETITGKRPGSPAVCGSITVELSVENYPKLVDWVESWLAQQTMPPNHRGMSQGLYELRYKARQDVFRALVLYLRDPQTQEQVFVINMESSCRYNVPEAGYAKPLPLVRALEGRRWLDFELSQTLIDIYYSGLSSYKGSKNPESGHREKKAWSSGYFDTHADNSWTY